MAKRKIIRIDEDKCNGCGACIPGCPEGAMQVIDGKARLVSDLFCDGLGACIGHCPQGAIEVIEREAAEYNEGDVMKNIVAKGPNVIKAHLEHLRAHNQQDLLEQANEFLRKNNITISAQDIHSPHGRGICPGVREIDLRKGKDNSKKNRPHTHGNSCLSQWPVQLMLVSPHASYFNDADLLIAADCVPFACADFHQDLLKGKILAVGCPKLDDMRIYEGKISQIITHNTIRSITYAHMEVPCCFGLVPVIQQAIAASGKRMPFTTVTISIKGEKLEPNSNATKQKER